jgi:hypothetical protein
MIKTDITFLPPLRKDDHGWLNIDGKILQIESIHHFDDFGMSMETLTLEDGQEVYSYDEGSTFTLDCD